MPQITVPQTQPSLAVGPLHSLLLPLHFPLLYLNLNLTIHVSDQGSLPQGSPLDHLRKVKSRYDRPLQHPMAPLSPTPALLRPLCRADHLAGAGKSSVLRDSSQLWDG